MAKFNPNEGERATPDFTRGSKGIRFDDARADTSFANLFEGLGEGALLGVQAADTGIQENIQNDIDITMDGIDAEFGVDSRTNLDQVFNETDANLPRNINDSMTHLEGLQQAREQGMLSESHYWARAQSLVRQMRGKYPGYREVIDDKIQSITGARPANALRRSLMQEWGEGAGDDQKRTLNQIEEMSKEGSLRVAFPDIDKRMAEGNLPTWNELILGQSAWMEEEAKITRGRARLGAQKEKGELDADENARTFRQETTQRGTSIMDQSVAKIEGETGVKLYDLTRKMQKDRASGKPWSPEEAQQLAATVDDVRLQMDAAFDAIVRDYVMEGIAPSPQEVETARQEFMKPLESLNEALTNKDTGGLHTFALKQEGRKLQFQSELIQQNPALEMTTALKDLVGSEILATVLANEPETMTAFQEWHRRIMLNNAMLGDPNDPERSKSIRKDLETMAGDKQVSDTDANVITKATMQGFVKTIEMVGSDNELPPEVLANYVEYMFGEEAFGATQHLSLDARKKFFATVSSPRVTKKMMELRDGGRPELWEKYQKWVANEFKTQFKGDVSQIQDYVLNPDVFDVHYDPQRMAFEFVMNPSLSPSEKLRVEHTGQVRVLEQTRRSINTAIQTLGPVIAANGMDPAEQIHNLLTTEMGYNPDAPPNEQTVVDGMLGALFQEFQLAAEDVRQGDLPIVGKRGAERLNAAGRGINERIRKSFWELTAPFSPQFRSPEERRGTDKRVEGRSILDWARPGRDNRNENFSISPASASTGIFESQHLQIENRISLTSPYGVAASRNAKPPQYLVMHHAVGDTDNLVKYGHKVDPDRGGSFGYHFYISEDGRVVQAAPLDVRTNHVKPKNHPKRKDVTEAENSNSLGITLVNAHDGATMAQMVAAEKLAKELSQTYGIPYENVVGHGELQSDRMSTEGQEIIERLRRNNYNVHELPIEDKIRLLELN